MSDAPKEIIAWANNDGTTQFEGGTLFPNGVAVSYIRADIARVEADALRAEVERLRGARIKPLVWDDFEGQGAKAQGWRKGSYLVNYWKSRDAFEVVESYPGYQGDSIGDGFYPTLEAAKAAAQSDYAERILSALAPAGDA